MYGISFSMVAPLSIMQFLLLHFMASLIHGEPRKGKARNRSAIFPYWPPKTLSCCQNIFWLRISQQPYDSGIRMTLHDAIITQFQKSYDPKYHILKKITFLSVCRVSWTAKACSNSPSTLHSSRSSQRTGPNANPHSTDMPESFSHLERGSQN